MTPFDVFAPQWQALNVLLDEALEQPVSAHASWLDALDGERAAHREVLRALLSCRANVETDDFLDRLPTLERRRGGAATENEVVGSRIGPYRLVSEIARGGMATVWLAELADRLPSGRVALKVPRAVWGDEFAGRLARERHLLATLEHAHIARLCDAGYAVDGRPYLAMEHIHGEPIDVHCRSRSLGLPARLELLLQLMAAVGHAHTKRIVHLDLKPGNILVTGAGEVKLIDFGIARSLDGECAHPGVSSAARALTPDYASPEQIHGAPLGATSDVYSLGVVAFELLSGVPPYRLRHGSVTEIESAIATIEPHLASEAAPCPQLRESLLGDLDAVLGKALKKPVDERYQSVDALAKDIGRWLHGEPVQAWPDGGP